MFRLHLDKDGKPQFNDKGLALFMQDGGTEAVPFDIDAMIDDNRQKKTAAEAAKKERDEIAAKLKAFDGLDAEASRKALEIAKQHEEGKLFDAGKLDELKAKYTGETAQKIANMEKALEDAKAKAAGELTAKEAVIHGLLVENAFSASSFLREKTVLLPDFAYASLGKNFAVEYQDGKPVVVAKDYSGQPIFSPSSPSAYASPEEAIKYLVEKHPQKDSLLKPANPGGGSGSRPGGGSGNAGVTSQKQFKNTDEKAKFIAEHGLDAFKALPAE
ncbi:MAG: hypothetical protein LBV80_07915 [Deltaproteobacteria bacterium]|jgi:hypothetical protein|nr:hypothetical protein [Deltaproteobacteria bacterium]